MDNQVISGINSAQDPTSPFFIHPSENRGTSLVAVPLNGDNYHTWSQAINRSIKTKNKLQFIDGSFPKPEIDDPNFANWDRCNTLVVSWMIQSIDASIS
ncbi:unnamed protein product [Lupinus luteus]|uniref:Retrotransposon Copia-like N-terminal domain-containing protein n=1 Tax=Lupinus luteus TaxID=3873 RepID=A0AAV1YAA0_LUPLU